MKVKAPKINLKTSTPKSVEPYTISANEIVSLVEEASNEKGYSLEEAEEIHRKRTELINRQLSDAQNRS